ncbi:hypothetical protein KY289_008252 [Solanum tuberosum]|nr:hypothetical protein KY289_008252 [Solanum tuberosum]
MALTIVMLQMHYRHFFLYDPELRADVSSPQQSDENFDTNTEVDQQPRVEEGKNKETGSPEVSLEDLDEDEGEGNTFSSYHLQTNDESNVNLDVEQFNSESRYDVDENIDDLSDLDDELDKARQPNIQEQNNRGRYEGKLGGNDLYFDSLDPGCDISEDEGDHIESNEVEDPPATNASTKNVEFREALQTYCIKKGVNLKQKPNEKERIRAKYKNGCP